MQVTSYLPADLAKEGNITINAIVPGLIGTEWRKTWAADCVKREGKTRQQWLHDFCLSKGILTGRCGWVEEVGDLAAFIASDRGRHLHGAKIALDGGLTVNAR